MKILLTNDDGIHASGLWAAARSLSAVGEVAVVAPDREQSGVGASMTLHAPVFAHQVPAEQYLLQYAPGDDSPPRSADAVFEPSDDAGLDLPNPINAWAVQGTPADSCILALEQLVNPKPDLVVSGINRGSNMGWDVIVSGTVGAAIQGFVRGYPTIAISVVPCRRRGTAWRLRSWLPWPNSWAMRRRYPRPTSSTSTCPTSRRKRLPA